MGESAPGRPERQTVERCVREAIEDNEVVLFLNHDEGVPDCRFSRRALSLVAEHRDEFEAVDVGDAPEAYRVALAARSGWVTVPQVFVDGRFVGDGDRLAELADMGTLGQTLLAE